MIFFNWQMIVFEGVDRWTYNTMTKNKKRTSNGPLITSQKTKD